MGLVSDHTLRTVKIKMWQSWLFLIRWLIYLALCKELPKDAIHKTVILYCVWVGTFSSLCVRLLPVKTIFLWTAWRATELWYVSQARNFKMVPSRSTLRGGTIDREKVRVAKNALFLIVNQRVSVRAKPQGSVPLLWRPSRHITTSVGPPRGLVWSQSSLPKHPQETFCKTPSFQDRVEVDARLFWLENHLLMQVLQLEKEAPFQG